MTGGDVNRLSRYLWRQCILLFFVQFMMLSLNYSGFLYFYCGTNGLCSKVFVEFR